VGLITSCSVTVQPAQMRLLHYNGLSPLRFVSPDWKIYLLTLIVILVVC